MPRVVAGIVFLLTSLLFVEQTVLRRRPSWLARFAFVPILRRTLALNDAARGRARRGESAAALDPARIDWPAGWSDDEMDVTPPSREHAGWVRVHSVAGKRFAGVARMAVVEEQGSLVVKVHYYPASFGWALGMISILVAVIVALAPWHVGIVLSVIVIAMGLVPSLSWLQTARSRLTRAVDELAQKIEHPPEPERKKRRARR